MANHQSFDNVQLVGFKSYQEFLVLKEMITIWIQQIALHGSFVKNVKWNLKHEALLFIKGNKWKKMATKRIKLNQNKITKDQPRWQKRSLAM